jgi:hypothetical protein
MPLAIGMPPHLKGMVPNNGNVGKKGSMVRAHIYTYMHIERNNHRASPMGFICFFIFSPPITPKVGQQLQPFGSI